MDGIDNNCLENVMTSECSSLLRGETTAAFARVFFPWRGREKAPASARSNLGGR